MSTSKDESERSCDGPRPCGPYIDSHKQAHCTAVDLYEEEGGLHSTIDLCPHHLAQWEEGKGTREMTPYPAGLLRSPFRQPSKSHLVGMGLLLLIITGLLYAMLFQTGGG